MYNAILSLALHLLLAPPFDENVSVSKTLTRADLVHTTDNSTQTRIYVVSE